MRYGERTVRVIAEASGQRVIIESVDEDGRTFRSTVISSRVAETQSLAVCGLRDGAVRFGTKGTITPLRRTFERGAVVDRRLEFTKKRKKSLTFRRGESDGHRSRETFMQGGRNSVQTVHGVRPFKLIQPQKVIRLFTGIGEG
ncbi:hypothetical protein VOI32_39770 [Paraburkholderia caribensis]|nr:MULTISPECIES: hypothetical protein [Paraburkholderia]MCO4881765.1 hypothetical protein [Paraburkholderia caribensis]